MTPSWTSRPFEWLIIDATHAKAHRHAAGAVGGSQAISRQKGANAKVHLAVDAHGMPVRAIVTGGTTADCTMACPLISGFDAEYVLADKGYDSQEIVDAVTSSGAEPVIPPRRCRKEQRFYDKHLYKARHLVENAFLRLKEWRGVATRYAKRTDSFLSIVQIRCMVYWLRVRCGTRDEQSQVHAL